MKKNDVTILSEDPTCAVMCCTFEPFVSSSHVFRCPVCGKGYRTEFNIYSYEKDETDTEFPDSPAINTPEYEEMARKEHEEFVLHMKAAGLL